MSERVLSYKNNHNEWRISVLLGDTEHVKPPSEWLALCDEIIAAIQATEALDLIAQRTSGTEVCIEELL